MAFLYDLLPPVIPDFIPPFTGINFQIPIFIYNNHNQDSLKNLGINAVQVHIIGQNNELSTVFDNWISGDTIYRDNKNLNTYILKLNTKNTNIKNENFFYKLQIRFSTQTIKEINANGGKSECFTEWSSICLIKKIKEPVLTTSLSGISLLKNQQVQIPLNFSFNLTGSLDENSLETLKSYQIIIKNKSSKKIKLKTDWLTPVSKNIFSYDFKQRIFENENGYEIIINFKTLSGYSSISQYVYKINIKDPKIKQVPFYFQTYPSPDTGDIKIRIFGGANEPLKQNFLIQRSSSENNFSSWENLAIVQFQSDKMDGTIQSVEIQSAEEMDLITSNGQTTAPNSDTINLFMYEWADKTIKSGIFYKYAVAPIYKAIISNNNTQMVEQILSSKSFVTGSFKQNNKPYTCIFDDMFLTGNGGQNLRIKYNPSISNFKYNIQENIQTTLGSKYPFINRNGKQKYRSFSIGGLITMFMDINDRMNVPAVFNDSKSSDKKGSIEPEPIIIKVSESQFNNIKTLFPINLQPGPQELLNRYSNEQLNNIKILEDLWENEKIQEEINNMVYNDVQLKEELKNQVYSSNENQREEAFEILKKIYRKIANVYNQVYIGEFTTPEDLFSDIEITSRRQYNEVNNISKFNDVIYEREFREAVYKFLYDKTPKLFRSNPQGNILVKLTNLSFSPVNELGRQLYSFSADAIEIDECSISNFNKYNIYKYGEWKILQSKKVKYFDGDIVGKDNIKSFNLSQAITSSPEEDDIIYEINNFQIQIKTESTTKIPIVNLQTMEYILKEDLNSNISYAAGWLIELITNNNQIKNYNTVFINRTKKLNLPKTTIIEYVKIKTPDNDDYLTGLTFHFKFNASTYSKKGDFSITQKNIYSTINEGSLQGNDEKTILVKYL